MPLRCCFIGFSAVWLLGSLLTGCAPSPEGADSVSSSTGSVDSSSGSATSSDDVASTFATSGTTASGECGDGTEFVGDLFVDDETDLSSLHCLVRIDGSLVVGSSANLTSPLPFESLQEVSGDLQIIDNAALSSLEGLGALLRVAGRVEIARNDALTSIRGLDALAELGAFEVYDNAQLVELRALAPSIHFLANDGGFATLSISGLPSLVDLSDLGHITSVDVDGTLFITVQFDDALVDISGLSGFFSEGANVDLQLLQLPAVEEVRLVGVVALGELDIGMLDAVSAVRLEALQSARRIEISRTPMLADLSGLGALSEVTDTLSLGGCGDGDGVGTLLTDLTGLGALGEVGTLQITGQPLLTSLAGLSTAVALEDLAIRNNAALPNDAALTYADTVDPTHDVSICGNMGAEPCADGCPIPD